jgi:hypothetical protein
VCSTSELVEASLSINIYPNPSTGMIYVKGSELTRANIQVIDMMGRIMYEENHSLTDQIDLSDLKKGTYLLRIHTENGHVFSKTLLLH